MMMRAAAALASLAALGLLSACRNECDWHSPGHCEEHALVYCSPPCSDDGQSCAAKLHRDSCGAAFCIDTGDAMFCAASTEPDPLCANNALGYCLGTMPVGCLDGYAQQAADCSTVGGSACMLDDQQKPGCLMPSGMICHGFTSNSCKD